VSKLESGHKLLAVKRRLAIWVGLVGVLALVGCRADVSEAYKACQVASEEFWYWVASEVKVTPDALDTSVERSAYCAQWSDDDAAGFVDFWSNIPRLSD
jgi:hypothetical protein